MPNAQHAGLDADVIVVGGGPAGATAAQDLAEAGRAVVLLDRAGRIKPCGGAIPPRAIRDFAIPDHLLVARARSARMVSPSARAVDMPIEGGFVGMVDREVFDPFLRTRAQAAGANLVQGAFAGISYDHAGAATVAFRPHGASQDAPPNQLRAKVVIGADGARSQVARAVLGPAGESDCVFAYHEIIEAPRDGDAGYEARRADVYYDGRLSPDFYAWIFPHGGAASVGVGSAQKGFSLRSAVRDLRQRTGLNAYKTLRSEGAPIPLKPLKTWDDGRGVVLAGDAAGVVAPASGEGIYYAMLGGRLAAEAAAQSLRTGPQALSQARKRFMAEHGRVFWILGLLQHFWYRNDKRRERFVTMCADPDVQALTWQAYMNKELVRANPGAHMRIFMKDLGHLFGVSRAGA
jgi:geranylgeranyl reductase